MAQGAEYLLNDERFPRVQKLFASGRETKADEGRALLREILKDAPSEGRSHKRPRRSPILIPFRYDLEA